MRCCIVLLAVISMLASGCHHSAAAIDEADSVKIYQVVKPDGKRFDLSGIVLYQDTLFAIADKYWNKSVYSIFPQDSSVIVPEVYIDITFPGDPDIEAIDYFSNRFFIADERSGKVFQVDKSSGKTVELLIDWGKENPASWGNAGWEGIALDHQQDVIYLFKERDPAMIFVMNTSGGYATKLEMTGLPENIDISDAKMKNGFLYLLNRNDYRILKWNPVKGEVVDEFSYRHIMFAAEEKFYANAKYPMAEGLEIDENYIWIALDNNGKVCNSENKWIEMANFAEDNPIIVRMKKPINF